MSYAKKSFSYTDIRRIRVNFLAGFLGAWSFGRLEASDFLLIDFFLYQRPLLVMSDDKTCGIDVAACIV